MFSFAAAQAAMGIFKGFAQYSVGKAQAKGAKQIRDAQLSAAKQTYEYNKKELSRVYSENFTNLMTQYAYEKGNFLQASNEAVSDLATNVSFSQSDVELNGSSMSTDSFNDLDYQLAQGFRNMQLNQMSAMDNMFENYSAARLENEQVLSQTNQAITQNYIDAKQQADLQKNQGILNMIGSGIQLGSEVYGSINTENSINTNTKSDYSWDSPKTKKLLNTSFKDTFKTSFKDYLQDNRFKLGGTYEY